MWGPPGRTALHPGGKRNRPSSLAVSLFHASGRDVDIHHAVAVPVTVGARAPCIAVDRNPVETAHVKAAPGAA